jgi:hypothetical protein
VLGLQPVVILIVMRFAPDDPPLTMVLLETQPPFPFARVVFASVKLDHVGPLVGRWMVIAAPVLQELVFVNVKVKLGLVAPASTLVGDTVFVPLPSLAPASVNTSVAAVSPELPVAFT